MSRKKSRKDKQAIVDAEQEIDEDLREEITRQMGRRDFLRKAGALAGVGAVGVGLGGVLGHSLASPGAGASGTTISDEDIDAKRIGGIRYASEFITGTVPAGTAADPYPAQAIQDAIDDLPSTGGIVYVSQGVWDIDTVLQILVTGTWLRGASRTATQLRVKTASAGIEVGASATNVYSWMISDLNVNKHGSYSPQDAIKLENAREGIIDNVRIGGGYSRTGIRFVNNCWSNRVLNTIIDLTNADGIWLGGETNALMVAFCQITNNDDAGIRVHRADGLKVFQCQVEGNLGPGIHIAGEGASGQARSIVIEGNYFEGNTRALLADQAGGFVTEVDDLIFSGNGCKMGSEDYAVEFANPSLTRAVVMGNYFYEVAVAGVRAQDADDYVLILGGHAEDSGGSGMPLLDNNGGTSPSSYLEMTSTGMAILNVKHRTSNPVIGDLIDGEINTGLVTGTGKIYMKRGSTIYVFDHASTIT